MSNRMKSRRERRNQSYRSTTAEPAIRTDGKGRVHRGEGRNNFGYGARPGASRSILNRVRTRPEETPDYEAMTRDQLRGVAKEQGHSGYGKMNKAELVALVGGAR